MSNPGEEKVKSKVQGGDPESDKRRRTCCELVVRERDAEGNYHSMRQAREVLVSRDEVLGRGQGTWGLCLVGREAIACQGGA